MATLVVEDFPAELMERVARSAADRGVPVREEWARLVRDGLAVLDARRPSFPISIGDAPGDEGLPVRPLRPSGDGVPVRYQLGGERLPTRFVAEADAPE